MEKQNIGIRIKQRRTELGLKQTQIKEITGISTGNQSDIENGNRYPSALALLALSEALDCSVDWILKGKCSDSKKSKSLPLYERKTELSNDLSQLNQNEYYEKVMKSIGERIRNRRKELNLTQVMIQSATGISAGALSEIENGNRKPSVIIFYILSQVLQCSMDWLATGECSDSENMEMLTEEEKELLEEFRQLDQDGRDELLGILDVKLQIADKKQE